MITFCSNLAIRNATGLCPGFAKARIVLPKKPTAGYAPIMTQRALKSSYQTDDLVTSLSRLSLSSSPSYDQKHQKRLKYQKNGIAPFVVLALGAAASLSLYERYKANSLVQKIENSMRTFANMAWGFKNNPDHFSDHPDKYQKDRKSYAKAIEQREMEIEADIRLLDSIATKAGKRTIDFFPQGKDNKHIRDFLEYAPFDDILHDVDYYELLGICSEDKKQIKKEILKKLIS